MRVLATALALLLLSGCWFGSRFYSPADARQAIAPGLWHLRGQAGIAEQDVRVAILPDGMTRIESISEPGEATTAGFVPLDAEGRYFITWSLPRVAGSAFDRVTVYGLLTRDAGGGWRLYVPACAQTRRIARAAGARIHHGEMDECGFRSRASLEAAFRRLIPQLARLGEPTLRLTPSAAP